MNTGIIETMDYAKFELHLFNRDVKKIKDLEKSMRAHGWIPAYPMHVVKNGNGKYKIKAGHHRFEVARSLKIPAKYVICDDTATIHELEKATTPWCTADYLTSYCRAGLSPYITVKAFHERSGIPIGRCVSLLAGEEAGSSNHLDRFRAGRYQLGDPCRAELVADIVIYVRDVCKNKIANKSLFVQAISKLSFIPEFDPAVFKHKASTHSFLLEPKANLESYLNMIDDVYNRQSKNRTPLAFLADQSSRARQAAFLEKSKRGE